MTKNTIFRLNIVASTLLAMLMLAGCSETIAPSPNIVERINGTETPAAPYGVGFLTDYYQLKPGQEGQRQWIYIDPQAQWSKYTKIIIASVTFIASADSKISAEEQQTLANYFYNQLKEQLSQKVTIVD